MTSYTPTTTVQAFEKAVKTGLPEFPKVVVYFENDVRPVRRYPAGQFPLAPLKAINLGVAVSDKDGRTSVSFSSHSSSWPINCITSWLKSCRESRRLEDLSVYVPDHDGERAYSMCLELCIGSDALRLPRELLHNPAVETMMKIEDSESQYNEVVSLLYSDEGLRIPGYREHQERFVRELASSMCLLMVRDLNTLQELRSHYKTFDRQLREAVKREKVYRRREFPPR